MAGLVAPLSSLANKRNVAVVCVMHLNKSEMRNAINRVSGSIAFVGAARAAWLVTKDKSNAERRLFLQVKNNLAPDPGGLAFSIVDGAVKWESGIVAVSANDALSDDPKKRGTPAYVECCGWLADKLQSGSKVPAEEIFDEGENSLGFSRSTIKKAKEELGIEAVKEGFGQNGRWVWFLPCSSLSGEPDPAVAA